MTMGESAANPDLPREPLYVPFVKGIFASVAKLQTADHSATVFSPGADEARAPGIYDLADGGAGAFVATIDAVRHRCPGVRVEVLIPDCRGDAVSLGSIFDARPDVLHHNIETVARLQRAVRPAAGYARSLAVLARAKEAGLPTKSSIMVGLGESHDEVRSTLADLAAIGVDIVTIGQYLRPTSNHLPVARWWEPHEFDELKAVGEAMGLRHVEASPLTRSSYHAKAAAHAADA